MMDDDSEATTEESEAGNRFGDRVLDGGALRALAHPIRVQIYDILSQYGPQTASTLATLTGESSGATSYHLRALAKQDLIRELEDRGTGRERWWERPKGGIAFGYNDDVINTPSARAAAQVVVREFQRRRHEQLMRFEERIEDEPVQWRDGALSSTGTARLTAAQMSELTLKLQTLIDETVDAYREQQGDGVRPVTIRADVFPLPNEERR